MKKKAVLAMGIVFGTAVFSGCGTGEVKEILDQTQANLNEVKSASGDMNFQVVINLAQQGLDMDMEASLEGDWKVNSQENAFAFDGSLNLNLMNLNMDVSIYSVQEDGKQVIYTKLGDTWSRSEEELTEETANYWEQFEAFSPSTAEVISKEADENPELHFVVTGEDVEKLLESVGLTAEDFGELEDMSALQAEIDLTVGKDDSLPVSATVDFGDSLSAAASAEEGTEVEISTCKIDVNVKDYNETAEISVPDEARDASETEGDVLDSLEKDVLGENNGDASEEGQPVVNEDGSYTLSDYENQAVATVKVPKNYNLDFAEQTYLSCSKDTEAEGSVSAIYQIVDISDDFTEENFENTYILTDQNIKDSGYSIYETTGPDSLNVGEKELSCITVRYGYEGDSVGDQIVLWEKMDDNHLLVCTVMASEIDGEKITDSVQKFADELFSGVNV